MHALERRASSKSSYRSTCRRLYTEVIKCQLACTGGELAHLLHDLKLHCSECCTVGKIQLHELNSLFLLQDIGSSWLMLQHGRIMTMHSMHSTW